MLFEGDVITPPVLLDASVPLSLAGDRLRQTLCIFDDHTGCEKALRPDMTLPIAMEIVSGTLPANGSFAYDGVAFRLPRNKTSTRPIEEPQIGFEWIGRPSDSITDVGALETAFRGAQDLGLGDCHLRVGHLGVFPALIAAMDLPDATAKRIINAYQADIPMGSVLENGPERPLDIADAVVDLPAEEALSVLAMRLEQGGMQNQGERPLEDVLLGLRYLHEMSQTPPLSAQHKRTILEILAFTDTADNAVENLDTLLKRLGVSGVEKVLNELHSRLKFNINLPALHTEFKINFPRRFTYYDGFCFEIIDTKTRRIFGAGGRYDSLLSRLSAGRVNGTAIGAALYPQRIKGYQE